MFEWCVRYLEQGRDWHTSTPRTWFAASLETILHIIAWSHLFCKVWRPFYSLFMGVLLHWHVLDMYGTLHIYGVCIRFMLCLPRDPYLSWDMCFFMLCLQTLGFANELMCVLMSHTFADFFLSSRMCAMLLSTYSGRAVAKHGIRTCCWALTHCCWAGIRRPCCWAWNLCVLLSTYHCCWACFLAVLLSTCHWSIFACVLLSARCIMHMVMCMYAIDS